MRFGNCVDLVAAAKGDRRVVDWMMGAKFDFLEANLTSLARATEAEFQAAKALAEESGMPVPVCNCMFPRDIRIAGGDQQPAAIREYVDSAFLRASALGVKKVVLGSDKSRQLPDGYDQDRAYAEFIDVVKECVVPYCEKYAITVVIEPLRKPCNFINTLPDGMRVVRGVNSPWVMLLADTIHMITSGENPDYVREICGFLRHVHVSDWNRALPEFGYSSELTGVLRAIRLSGYDGDFSFEASAGKTDQSLQRALILLKQKLGA